MTTVSRVFKNAGIVKSAVLNHQKLGAGEQWGFVFAEEILTPGKPVPGTHCKKASNPQGQEWKGNIKQEEYKAMAKQVISFVNKNNKMKDFVSFVRKGTTIKLETKVYVYLFARIVRYYEVKHKLPKEMALDTSVFKVKCKSPFISSPHWTEYGAGYLGQINPYNCGPHSIRQSIKKFGINISESTLASWAGTTTSGTDHEGINTAIAKAAKEAGVKIDVEWVNFSSLGFKALGELLCQPNVAAFLHILYSGAGEYYDPDDECGHYEYCNRVNTATKYVQALNSLGSRDGYGYYGHLQDRSFNLQERYISGISQKSVCILRLRK